METFVAYFLSLNLLLAFQAVYYRLFLARQRRFGWNRTYLLGGMAAALLLPLLRWEILPATLPNPVRVLVLPEMVIGEAPSVASPVAESWSAVEIAFAVYALGVLTALTSLLFRNLTIVQLIRQGKKTRLDGYTLVETTRNIGPASYFRYIFWNADAGFDALGAQVALAHERCHSRQLHSLDLLALELLKAFCWINPALYLLRKYLRETHELLADQAALKIAGQDGIKRLLLLHQLGPEALSIPNYFYSHVKTRIMILSENPKRKAILRYLLALPLAGLMAACTSSAQPLSSDNSFVAASSDSTYVAADSQRTATTEAEAAYKGYFNLDDVFVEAQLPLASGEPRKEGLTCLGHVPDVMNLDSALRDDPRAFENFPKLLNGQKVRDLIGYPKEAQEKKITGKVLTKLLVDETGHVIRCIFIEEVDPILRNAVFNNVKELRFKPGLHDGKPAEWWVIMPFSFGLGGC